MKWIRMMLENTLNYDPDLFTGLFLGERERLPGGQIDRTGNKNEIYDEECAPTAFCCLYHGSVLKAPCVLGYVLH